MNLDYPNKNEQQMKKSVEQFEAPFDPAAWQDLQAKMPESATKSTSGNGHGRRDRMPPPGISFILKTFLIMTFIALFSFILWFGFNPTTEPINTTSTKNINTNINTETSTESSATSSILLNPSKKENQSIINLPNENLSATNNNAIEKISGQTIEKQKKEQPVNTTLSPGLNSQRIKSDENNTAISDKSEKKTTRFFENLKMESLASQTNIQHSEKLDTLTETGYNSPKNIDDNSEAIFLQEKIFRSSNYGLNLLPLVPLPKLVSDSSILDQLETGVPTDWSIEPIGDFRRKRYTFGVFAGASYSTINDTPLTSYVVGLAMNARISEAFSLQVESSYRKLLVDAEYFVDVVLYDIETGKEAGYRSWHRELNTLQVFELPVTLSYHFSLFNKTSRNFRVYAGLRPTLSIIPFATGGGSSSIWGNVKSPEYTEPHYKEGVNNFDLGVILGVSVPISRRLHLDLRANLGSKDITDDTFWNVDPQRNVNTDFQITLRWDLFNF